MDTQTDTVALDSRLGVLLVELMRVVNQRTAGQTLRLMCEAELSMPQMVTLLILQRCGAKSVSAIAERLQLSLAATSQLVDGLVRRGFASRNEDTLDRRVKMIALRPEGAELLDRLAHSRGDEIAQSMALLPDETMVQAVVALEEVLLHLQQLPD